MLLYVVILYSLFYTLCCFFSCQALMTLCQMLQKPPTTLVRGLRNTNAIHIAKIVFFCPKACAAVISEHRTASSHFMFSASCVLKNFLPMRLPAQNCMRQHTRLTAAKHASRPLSMLLSIIVRTVTIMARARATSHRQNAMSRMRKRICIRPGAK